MSKVSGSNEPSERLTQLNQLGFQLFQEKLYPQALEVLQQVVDLTQGQLGPSHAELGVALLNRGRVYRLLERNAECEADYRQALKILRLSRATFQDQIIWLLKNLIALYRNTGRRSEAEPSVQELLAVQRIALPPGDPRLADVLVDLGGACYERGALQEAKDLVSEALAIREAALGARMIQKRSNFAIAWPDSKHRRLKRPHHRRPRPKIRHRIDSTTACARSSSAITRSQANARLP
ncbi:MAG TPA: tetratricopeptide repeat protein [Candidatus Sulfotelmatobacter sp.]|jgi:tetratricopeptide (TPR) repeat protein|nr:tetratricopeptide repeat protein [Candidatus Sulfotelmatobacter sp.]